MVACHTLPLQKAAKVSNGRCKNHLSGTDVCLQLKHHARKESHVSMHEGPEPGTWAAGYGVSFCFHIMPCVTDVGIVTIGYYCLRLSSGSSMVAMYRSSACNGYMFCIY